MNVRCLIIIILILLGITRNSFSQASSYTRLDTARINDHRAKKISCEYWYDSVSGKLNGRVDTGYVKYDTTGRETVRRSVLEGGDRYMSYFFYNQQGQLVRKMSCINDSSDGSVDTWDYDTLGRVVSEKTIMRNSSGYELFRSRVFQYDSLNRLVKELETYASDKTGTRNHISHVVYSNTLTIKFDLFANGDTFMIDTTYRSGGLFWSRIYFFETEAYSDRKIKKQSSSYRMITDTIGARNKAKKKTIIGYESYLYRRLRQNDTLYRKMNNMMIERRGILYIDDFVYGRQDEFIYMIRWNRKGQPIFRRTESYTYYK